MATTTRTKLTIEKFDEGITIRCNNDGGEAPLKRLAVKGREAMVLGDVIWSELQDIFDIRPTDFVNLTVEFNEVYND